MNTSKPFLLIRSTANHDGSRRTSLVGAVIVEDFETEAAVARVREGDAMPRKRRAAESETPATANAQRGEG